MTDDTTPKKLDKAFQPNKGVTPVNTKSDDRRTTPDTDKSGDEQSEKPIWRRDMDFPPSWTLYEKMSKETAMYQQGRPFENCAKCNYYQGGQCKIVRGHILGSMVCRYFSEKYTPMTITIGRK